MLRCIWHKAHIIHVRHINFLITGSLVTMYFYSNTHFAIEADVRNVSWHLFYLDPLYKMCQLLFHFCLQCNVRRRIHMRKGQEGSAVRVSDGQIPTTGAPDGSWCALFKRAYNRHLDLVNPQPKNPFETAFGAQNSFLGEDRHSAE